MTGLELFCDVCVDVGEPSYRSDMSTSMYRRTSPDYVDGVSLGAVVGA